MRCCYIGVLYIGLWLYFQICSAHFTFFAILFNKTTNSQWIFLFPPPNSGYYTKFGHQIQDGKIHGLVKSESWIWHCTSDCWRWGNALEVTFAVSILNTSKNSGYSVRHLFDIQSTLQLPFVAASVSCIVVTISHFLPTPYWQYCRCEGGSALHKKELARKQP